MISEQRLQKYHTDGVLLLRLGKCFWLVMQREKFSSKSNTHMCVVTRHQYGISALVSQTSFRREISGGIVKCRLFFLRLSSSSFLAFCGNYRLLRTVFYGLFIDCAAKVVIFCYRRCYCCTFELLATFLQTLLPKRPLPSSSFFSFKNEEVNIKTTSATISFFTSPPFFLLDFSIIPDFLLLR